MARPACSCIPGGHTFKVLYPPPLSIQRNMTSRMGQTITLCLHPLSKLLRCTLFLPPLRLPVTFVLRLTRHHISAQQALPNLFLTLCHIQSRCKCLYLQFQQRKQGPTQPVRHKVLLLSQQTPNLSTNTHLYRHLHPR
jgi:hypothetical protein